jgi:glycosyltransferase involved in cell wall biosynthesis
MSSKKRILLIGPAHPLRGGLATFNERLIREYREMGHDAEIWTFSLQYPSLLFPGKTQYSSEPAPTGIPIRIIVNSINPLNWLKVGRMIRNIKPDLLIVKFWIPFMAPCFGTICRIARKNNHTRVVTILDNLIPHEARPFDRFLAGYWINSVDGCITMSRSVLVDLTRLFPGKSAVYSPHPLYDNFGEAIPRQVSLDYLQLDQKYRYLLFFGFIRDYKGLDLLLLAVADQRIKQLEIRLIVAGEFYCDQEPYRKLIREHELEDRVIMKNDFIPDSQVVHYFCAADLVVQPYKSATQSGVTQIAYHFNKPMVITDVGGLAEFVPHEKVGYVVKPEPSAIADAIIRYYLEKKEMEFSANAAVEKQRYSWNTMTEAIDRLLISKE